MQTTLTQDQQLLKCRKVISLDCGIKMAVRSRRKETSLVWFRFYLPFFTWKYLTFVELAMERKPNPNVQESGSSSPHLKGASRDSLSAPEKPGATLESPSLSSKGSDGSASKSLCSSASTSSENVENFEMKVFEHFWPCCPFWVASPPPPPLLVMCKQAHF